MRSVSADQSLRGPLSHSIEHAARLEQFTVCRGQSGAELVDLLRVAFVPWGRLDLAQRAMRDPEGAGCEPSSAWPVAAEDGWSRWRTDGAWHAVYWIRESPCIAWAQTSWSRCCCARAPCAHWRW
jgi:hypothetical protein